MKFIPLSHPMEVRYGGRWDPGTSLGTRPMVWFLDYVRIMKLIIHRTREETKDVESNDKGDM